MENFEILNNYYQKKATSRVSESFSQKNLNKPLSPIYNFSSLYLKKVYVEMNLEITKVFEYKMR